MKRNTLMKVISVLLLIFGFGIGVEVTSKVWRNYQESKYIKTKTHSQLEEQ